MVLEVQERGRYLLKACTKCGGDLILGGEEPYCLQCGDIVYVEINSTWVRDYTGYSVSSLKKTNRFLERHKDIVKLLGEGHTSTSIADILDISRRTVFEVKTVLEEIKGE